MVVVVVVVVVAGRRKGCRLVGWRGMDGWMDGWSLIAWLARY